MRAVDTNILVYATMGQSPFHAPARALLEDLAHRAPPWAIPWPCIYEFLRIVTHPRIYRPAIGRDAALGVIRALTASPSLLLLGQTPRHMEVLEVVLADGQATGNLVYDAHIAALCVEHGVDELLSADADFRRFRCVRVTNPFRD